MAVRAGAAAAAQIRTLREKKKNFIGRATREHNNLVNNIIVLSVEI